MLPAEGACRTIRQAAGSGAWRALSAGSVRGIGRRRTGRGQFARLNLQDTVFEFVRILEQSALGRTCGALAVAIIGAAVTWAEEKIRLREPAHGASEMGAVDREYLELVAFDVPHPARCIGGFAVESFP